MAGLEPFLACPQCLESLEPGESDARCATCKLAFARREGRLDLRLQRPKTVTLPFELEPRQVEKALDLRPLRMRDVPEVDFTGVSLPVHLTRELVSYFPRARGPGSLMLDLGCGSGSHRVAAEHAGFRYVGIDNDETSGASFLADAHALPFKDATFEFVLSIAVLEHIRFPFVALHEARRVLQPGGKLVGTVAFLEPFHGNSYYHHTHLGAASALEASGFKVESIAPVVTWPALLSLANLALFPRLPLWMASLLVWPLNVLHRIWWRLGRLRDPRATEEARLLLSAGAFSFIATRS